MSESSFEGGAGAGTEVPASLPTLCRGAHPENDHRCAPMEAACWLSGEPWSLHPRSVHPVIAAVANAASEELDDATHQQLWPLILASIQTRRRLRFVCGWRLRRLASRSDSSSGEALLDLWWRLLVEYERYGGSSRLCRAVGRIVRETVLCNGWVAGSPFFY